MGILERVDSHLVPNLKVREFFVKQRKQNANITMLYQNQESLDLKIRQR